MKKLLAFTLILVLCLSVVLVACNDKDDNNVKKLPAPAEHLEEARNAVEKTYNTERVSEETDVDYTLSKAVPLNGIYSYPITWTVSDSRITVDNHSDTEVLINVPDESPVEIKYTLTATITADNGTTAKVEFQHTVPEFKLYDYAGYAAAKDGVKINIDGIVTAILPKDNGASNSGFYMNTVDNDGKPNGGVYVYNPEASTDDIKVGMTVRVAGTKQNYSGTHEIVSCKKIKVLDSTIKTVEPVDYTEAFKNAKDLKATELVGKQAMLVTIKGVEIAENGGSDGSYYYFTLGEKKTYVRISSSSCPLTTAEQESFKTFFTGHRGYTADVTGVVCLYSGAFYLTPATAPVFTNEFMKTYTNEEKVDRAIEATEIPSSVESDVELALANKSQVHDDVAIAWAFKEGTTPKNAKIENGKLIVTLGENEETITLVATFTIGEGDAKLTKTKEFKITVDAASQQEYLVKPITEAKAGTYKLTMMQAKLGKMLYFTGEIDSSEYLVTSDKYAKAADVTVAAVDGGYTIKVGEKFVEIYKNTNGKNRPTLVDTATGAWKWNEEAKLFTFAVDGKDYYLGTFNTYNTISASAVSYITGDNLGKIGVSQFVALCSEVVEAEYKTTPITEAKAGTYKLAMDQAKLGKLLYFTGEINSSEYLVTSDKLAKAADVTVAAVDGGYTIKVGEKFVEIYKNTNGKNRPTLVDTATGAWKWNEEAKLFTFAVDGKDYYLGTFNTYNTISASAVSYITGDNLGKIGVSQFVALCSEVVEAEYKTTPITEAKAGTYKLAMDQAKLGKLLYFTGEINSSEYLVTSDKLAKAADVTVAAVDGGYTIKVGEKFVEIYKNTDGKIRPTLVDTATGAWKWNEEAKLFTFAVDGKDYYLGTFNKYNTISASEVSYITGKNLSNIGVSQFVALCTIKELI